MGKVQYGGGVTAIDGSIGGWTFHQNRSGNIVRARGSALKNSSTKQTIAHQDHIRYLQLWQALSAANKTLWNDYAALWTKTNKFGQVRTLSGMNWFESTNYNRELVGQAVLNAPPVHDLPIDVQTYTVTIDATSIVVEFAPAFNPADNALLIFTTAVNTRITTTQRQAQRLTKVINAGPYGVIDITADWEATHGISFPPGVTRTCGMLAVEIRTVNINSGIASTALSLTGEVDTEYLPGNEGNLGFWLESDYGVTAGAGGDVSEWQDRSVNAYHLSQATVGQRPIITPNEFGTEFGIIFDGVDDILFRSIANPFNAVQNYTCFMVMKTQVNNNREGSFSMSDEAGNANFFWITKQLSNKFNTRTDTAGVTNAVDGNSSINDNLAKCCISESDGNDWFERVNRIDQALTVTGSNTGGAPGDFAVLDNIALGGIKRLTPLYARSNFAAVLFYTVRLSTDARTRVEDYLINKYNV